MMRFAVLILSCHFALFAQARTVAITIDDLPRGGDLASGCSLERIRALTSRLLTPFREQRIPLIGFVNEGQCPELGRDDLREILRTWRDAGAELGNHTHSHLDLNTTTIEDFERDVIRGESLLESPRYFRHPFLHVGIELSKRRTVEQFLEGRGYRIAPVTLDNSDWMFAAVYARALDRGDRNLVERVRAAYLPYMESIVEFFEKRSVEVTGHEVSQTLLVHANDLNAECMPALIAMFRKRGYRFVTLQEALTDPAYSMPDRYAGKAGFSWIHHWSMTKGMPNKGEPDEPAWIRDAFKGGPGGPAQTR